MRTQLLAVLLLASSCVQDGISAQEALPSLDENFFRCQVQPVLTASCAFMDCHGNGVRPLSIYAEQRYRLEISWDDFETPITDDELAANLRTVAGFVARDDRQPQLLSEKPLDTRAGGLFHRGRDLYGNDDVFLSRDHPGYRILRELAQGAQADPGCVPGEDP